MVCGKVFNGTCRQVIRVIEYRLFRYWTWDIPNHVNFDKSRIQFINNVFKLQYRHSKKEWNKMKQPIYQQFLWDFKCLSFLVGANKNLVRPLQSGPPRLKMYFKHHLAILPTKNPNVIAVISGYLHQLGHKSSNKIPSNPIFPSEIAIFWREKSPISSCFHRIFWMVGRGADVFQIDVGLLGLHRRALQVLPWCRVVAMWCWKIAGKVMEKCNEHL